MRIARILQVLAAMVLCGIGAEVLSGYAAGTGDPGAVAVQLVFFAALYGAPAVLVRDAVRRASGGWPSLLVLVGALGLAGESDPAAKIAHNVVLLAVVLIAGAMALRRPRHQGARS